jgi:hypothetical protein
MNNTIEQQIEWHGSEIRRLRDNLKAINTSILRHEFEIIRLKHNDLRPSNNKTPA